jgi:outer membrane translocation and assembly module TamA
MANLPGQLHNSTDRIGGLQSRERAFLGATLGATQMNDLPVLRTDMNGGQRRVRGHGLV